MKTDINNVYVQNLISNLKKVGINFEFDQQETDVHGVYGEHMGKRRLENVIFTKGKYTLHIWEYIFFRNGGICQITEMKKSNKKSEQNYVSLHIITDEEFYQMKFQQIIHTFNVKENGENKSRE